MATQQFLFFLILTWQQVSYLNLTCDVGTRLSDRGQGQIDRRHGAKI